MESVVLCSWDHIMGPQIEKLWLINPSSLRTLSPVPEKVLLDFNMSKHCKNVNYPQNLDLNLMKMYSIICGQLLLGEVDSGKKLDDWSSRLYISENKILLCVMFHVDLWKCSNLAKDVKSTCLCLGLIFKNNAYPIVLHNHLIIDKHIRKTVHSIKTSQFSLDACSKDITALVEDVTELMKSMERNKLIIMTTPISFRATSNGLPLQQAIVSHLQTSGCCAVIGSSKFLIDEIVYLLATFTSQRKLIKSPVISQQFENTYIMGLCIRNTNEDADKSRKFLLERAAKELSPLTVIDLTEMKVWQTIPFQAAAKFEKKSHSLVEEIGSLVPELINDLIFLERNENKGCKAFIQDFCHMLMMKSCALIKTVEYYRCSGKFLTKNNLMTMLAIQNRVDLDILVGCAENIKPGIRSSILDQL